jgi:hypothetical protein
MARLQNAPTQLGRINWQAIAIPSIRDDQRPDVPMTLQMCLCAQQPVAEIESML